MELMSDSRRAGSQFIFQEKLNLIMGNDNDIGKSSLVKSILWALGCEPYFDDDWRSIDCKGILDFSIGDLDYSVARYKDLIYLKEPGKDYRKYARVTGEYADIFAKLVGFSALLPSRSKDDEVPNLDTPPPAFYFLPYYLDQKLTWAKPWSSLDKLGQYANWQRTIINYHTGYLVDEHFDIEDRVYESKYHEANANVEIDRIDKAISVVTQYSPESEEDISDEAYESVRKDIDVRLTQFCADQEKLLEDIAELKAEKEYTTSQLVFAESAIKQLGFDYEFAIENVNGDSIECPICGTEHDNSLLNRSGILADKAKLEVQSEALKKELNKFLDDLRTKENELANTRTQIGVLERRYLKPIKTNVPESSLLVKLATRTVKESVSKALEVQTLESKKQSDIQNGLKKDQKKLLPKKSKELLDSDFSAFLSSYVSKLKANRVNLSRVNKPTDYTKVYNTGGAAHSSRAILAYYLATYSQCVKHGTSTVAPLIIDTPNQHEQSDINYESIVSVLTSDVLGGGQVILCAMENNALNPYKAKAKVITLDSEQLFRKSDYAKLTERFNEVFSNG